MSHGDEQIGTPGPFEVRFDDAHVHDCANDSAVESCSCAAAGENGDENPKRVHECANYDRCLDLAAALNWESFTCRGCCGEINKALTWRAGQMARKDSVAKALCGLPKITTYVGSSTRMKKVENS